MSERDPSFIQVFHLPHAMGEHSPACERLLAGESLEVSRFSIGQGERVPPRDAAGETLLFCVRGSLSLLVDNGMKQQLTADTLIYIPSGLRYSLLDCDGGELLVITARKRRHQPDGVDEASLESFPASDAPSFTPSA